MWNLECKLETLGVGTNRSGGRQKERVKWEGEYDQSTLYTYMKIEQ
jgi:hypothetical protein